MDGWIAAICGYDPARVIWQVFCFSVKSSSLFAWALSYRRANTGLGRGKGDANSKRWAEGLLSHFVIPLHHQTDAILLLFSQIFQHLTHLNDWSSSPFFLHLLMYDAVQTVRPLSLRTGTKTTAAAQEVHAFFIIFQFTEFCARVLAKLWHLEQNWSHQGHLHRASEEGCAHSCYERYCNKLWSNKINIRIIMHLQGTSP